MTIGIRGSLLLMLALAADAVAVGLINDWFDRVI